MDTEKLEVGQEIAINTSRNYFSGTFLKFSTIKKITKTGIATLENGWRFNKYGDELKSPANPYPSGYLVPVEAAQSVINREKATRERKAKIQRIKDKADRMADETLDKIIALIEEV
jgi:hypothetical protein